MRPGELPDRYWDSADVSNSEVPQLHCIVLARGQKGVEAVSIPKRIVSFIVFDCMNMLIVSIHKDLDGLVRVNINDDHLLVRPSEDSYVALGP